MNKKIQIMEKMHEDIKKSSPRAFLLGAGLWATILHAIFAGIKHHYTK